MMRATQRVPLDSFQLPMLKRSVLCLQPIHPHWILLRLSPAATFEQHPSAVRI